MSIVKRVVVITGASRGIGARIAIELDGKYERDTLFILIARDQTKLEETRGELLKSTSRSNRYYTLRIDFSNAQQGTEYYKRELESVLKQEDLKSASELFVFYNHGTLKLQLIEEAANECGEGYQTNVVSVWKFLAAIRQLFPIRDGLKQYHVNLSSKMANVVSPSWSLYTTTRIARATLFSCLAAEQPTLRVLNYQPGPVYTDMLKSVNDFMSNLDAEFTENYKKGSFLTSEQTTKKLLKIITDDSFTSGCSIDYYDYE